MRVGSLVRSASNDLGIGKIVALNHTQTRIEYFRSVGDRFTETVYSPYLCAVTLQRQSRCYVYLDERASWVIGRIDEWHEDEREYSINLPDKKIISVSEAEVFVRCRLPIDDPIDILAMKGQETPYFYDYRSRLFQCLIQQRGVSWGMTGLLSSNISLYPHQVEVIRRVLEDPIQRYLLADEVGLGKTIEAGVILRQYLLDEPEGKALILVPRYLVAQWSEELEDKFYISYFPERVKLSAIEDWETLQERNRLWERAKLLAAEDWGTPQDPTSAFNFLILDEAHHIAGMATSNDPSKTRCFDTITALAHRCDRLLLLSATPVLNHEQDFLTMLHLLDPLTYKLDDLEGFRERVEKRQEIGRILLAFKRGANPFILKTKLKQLQSLFSEDSYLLNLAAQLEQCLQAQEASRAERDKLVSSIRNHISDTYRLHRRMLRNSRSVVEDAIFARNAVPQVEYDLDERAYLIHELLEEWRTVAPSEDYSHLFLILFRASNTWWIIFQQVLEARAYDVVSPELMRELGIEDREVLTGLPKFSGEDEIIEAMLKIVRAPSQEGDRIQLVKTIVLHHLARELNLQSFLGNLDLLGERIRQRIDRPIKSDRLPKLVIFTSFSWACTEIYLTLSQIFGQGAIAKYSSLDTRETLETNIERFKHNPQCFLFVSDSSGEEGLNLQFVDGLIHFDLPWSPNRLEQRLGRVDRINGKQKTNSWLLPGVELPDSIGYAWYKLLEEGFGIFDNSIASLQFYVDKRLSQLEKLLFRAGSAGLLESIEEIKAEIAAEIVKINEQNALDEIDSLEEKAIDYFEALDTYDACHQDIKSAMEGWLCRGLQFIRRDDDDKEKIVSYKPTKRTLIPADDLIDRFSPYAREKGGYDRRLVNQHSGVNLYRIGEGLTDSVASYLDWDDRGKAFAMWRQEASWDSSEGEEWIGFRFDYVVQADLKKVQEVIKESAIKKFNYQALQRRTDGLFPPHVETIFLDSNLERVQDEELLKILHRPYRAGSKGGNDYNLAKKRLPVIDQFIEPGQWPHLCRHVRARSETLLRERTSFIELCQQRSDRAARKLENRLNQLQLRLARGHHPQLAREIELEQALSPVILEGIRSPSLKLDSVGFIIISGRSPVASNTPGEDDSDE